MKLLTRPSFVLAATGALCLGSTLMAWDAAARPGGGGGGGGRGGGGARTSVNHGGGGGNVNRGANVNRNANANVNRNVNANVNRNASANVNRNVNANVTRNANVNVDRNVNVNGYRGGYNNGWNHPVGTGLAVVGAAAVIGSIVYSLPPSCSMVQSGGVTYQRCGSTWYQPRYSGTSVQYVVVNSPY